MTPEFVVRRPALTLLLWWLVLATCGMAILARLLPALAAVLPATSDVAGAHHEVVRRALTRLLLAQFLLPPVWLVAAALVVWGFASPLVHLSGGSSRAMAAAVVVGLAPVVLHRIGQLVTIWALPDAALATPGAVIESARLFATGPLPVLRAMGHLPGPLLQRVLEHATLVDCAIVGLWAKGLADAGEARLGGWHVAAAAAALATGVAATHFAAPLALPFILGR